MSRRIALSLWMLAAILSIMTLTATGFGALPLPVSLLWNGSDEAMRQIWLTIRLPRVLLALVIGGALAGLAGIVVKTRNETRLVLQIDMLGQAASVEIGTDMIEVIDETDGI